MFKAKLLVDKPKDSKAKTYYALKNDIVTVYNQNHGNVWLCKNSKNEEFSIHKDKLKIIE